MMGTQRCQDSNSGIRRTRQAGIDAQGSREWPLGGAVRRPPRRRTPRPTRSQPHAPVPGVRRQKGSNFSDSAPGGVGRAERRPEVGAPPSGSCSSAPSQLGAILASSGRGLPPGIPPRSAEREGPRVENKAEPGFRAPQPQPPRRGRGKREDDRRRAPPSGRCSSASVRRRSALRGGLSLCPTVQR